mmetsp:Transcript_129806/g.252893  ORF Transcript_129806/g.252893 Transcript_129806/m.252893 type:complete len:549 (+) Transcript_129806:59-1705(+)
MSQSILQWAENNLRNEREALSSLLQERHDNFLEMLAKELSNTQETNGASTMALDPNNAADIHVIQEPLCTTPASQLPKDESKDESKDEFDMAASRMAPQVASMPEGDVPGAVDDMDDMDRQNWLSLDSCRKTNFDKFRIKVKSLLENPVIEAMITFLILANSIVMGVEAQMELKGNSMFVFIVLEHIFLLCFTIELCLRIVAYTASVVYKNGWVAFDAVLVVIGILGNYIITPILEHVKDNNNDMLKDTFRGLLVMRVIRLFRLARIVRLLAAFRTLWMLITGLLSSAWTITYTMCLITVIIYTLSCMSIEIITKRWQDSANADISALVAENFSDLPVTMLSLLQFVIVDGVTDLYFPLVMEDPVLLLFFIPCILLVSISLMNLVTAVIVEGAIEHAKQDRVATQRYRRRNFKKLMPHLKAMFKEMDRDGSHALTQAEVVDAPEHIKMELQQYLHSDSLSELFEMIDVDEDGAVDVDEFCDSIGKLLFSDAPVEMIRVMKQLKIIRRQMTVMLKEVYQKEMGLSIDPALLQRAGTSMLQRAGSGSTTM